MGHLADEGIALASHQASDSTLQPTNELTNSPADLQSSTFRTIAHQPHNREPEEVEQAISFIRTGMYLPTPEDSDVPAELEISERSSPTPETSGLADTVDLTEAASLPDEADKDTKSDAGLKKQRRIQSNAKNRFRLLEPALVRALVSVAENQEDAFQRVCLETLAELCRYRTISQCRFPAHRSPRSRSGEGVLDINALLDGDAFRVLLQAIEQGPYDMSRAITLVLLQALDSPLTRESLPVHTGIEVCPLAESLTESAERLCLLGHFIGLYGCLRQRVDVLGKARIHRRKRFDDAAILER